MVIQNRRKNYINIIMLVILLASTFFSRLAPILSILMFVSAITMTVISMQSNLILSISALVLSLVIVFITNGNIAMIQVASMYLIPSLIVGCLFGSENIKDLLDTKILCKGRKNAGSQRFISIKFFLLAIIIFAFGMISYYTIMKNILNIDLIKIFGSNIDKFVTSYKNLLKPEDLKKIEETGVFNILQDSGTLVLITIYVRSIALALISYFIGIPLVKGLYKENVCFTGIENIFLPGKPVILLFVTSVILFFIGRSYPAFDMQTVINNFILIMNMLFFLEGASLIIYTIKRWAYVKGNVNWILFIFLIVFMGLVPGISVIGMLDNVFNYRERWDVNLNNNGGRNER